MIWNYFSPSHTVFGEKSIEQTVEKFKMLKASKPLFVLSQRIVELESIQRIFDSFEKNKISYNVTTKVKSESPINLVQDIYDEFRMNNCDSIIAIGGGSAIDLSKAVAILTTNEGNIEDYLGLHNVPKPTVPKIFIPTTAGTGSEATNISVLSNKNSNSKIGIVSHHLFADIAILDPTLTYSMPRELVLSTGMDAFCQCVEGYTSKNISPILEIMALKGIELISTNIENSLDGQKDARKNMLLGSYLSGIVIAGGNAGTNIGHAIGNTIGGMFGSPHGITVTAVLEQSMKFNATDSVFSNQIKKIKHLTNIDIFEFINSIKNVEGLPSLNNIGVRHEHVGEIAEKVIKDQQRLLSNNQKSVTKEDIITILSSSIK